VAQDTYDPARALSSEALFLKQNPNQRAMTQPGQRYLALDTYSFPAGFQRKRFFIGDELAFTTRHPRQQMRVTIASINDSTFSYVVINELARKMEYIPVPLTEVRRVRVFRRIPWVTEGAFMLPLAGLIFVAADFINPGMDGQRFTTDSQAVAIGGAFVGTGLICYKLSFTNPRIRRNNRLKVLQTY
jgi:hypothetical protein